MRAAPAPAALPTALTESAGMSGMRPSTMAWTRSMWAPKATARAMPSSSATPPRSMSRSIPARRAALASWIALTSFWVTEIGTGAEVSA